MAVKPPFRISCQPYGLFTRVSNLGPVLFEIKGPVGRALFVMASQALLLRASIRHFREQQSELHTFLDALRMLVSVLAAGSVAGLATNAFGGEFGIGDMTTETFGCFSGLGLEALLLGDLVGFSRLQCLECLGMGGFFPMLEGLSAHLGVAVAGLAGS
jgi:hypothetical protein